MLFTFSLFLASGAVITTLTIAKRREERKKKSVFFLRLISRGDERARALHHEALRLYSLSKEKFSFWLTKQIPMKVKSLTNRFQAYLREKGVEYFGDMRDSRLLNRSDGISEFFKSISEIEKGGGEINDTLHHGEINEDFYIETEPALEELAPLAIPEFVLEEKLVEKVEPEVIIKPVKKPRAPRKKKVALLETVE